MKYVHRARAVDDAPKCCSCEGLSTPNTLTRQHHETAKAASEYSTPKHCLIKQNGLKTKRACFLFTGDESSGQNRIPGTMYTGMCKEFCCRSLPNTANFKPDFLPVPKTGVVFWEIVVATVTVICAPQTNLAPLRKRTQPDPA